LGEKYKRGTRKREKLWKNKIMIKGKFKLKGQNQKTKKLQERRGKNNFRLDSLAPVNSPMNMVTKIDRKRTFQCVLCLSYQVDNRAHSATLLNQRSNQHYLGCGGGGIKKEK
jgi:hypothetical protein